LVKGGDNMKKIFVIDTNVLLMDPFAIFSFSDNEVIIPLAVVEEIDDQKNKSSDIGYNARVTSRLLDKLRKKGNLSSGVKLENGGNLRITVNGHELILPEGLSSTKMDNRIISMAYHIQKENPDKKVVLISNDINLRLIANALNLEAEEHESNKLRDKDIYTGMRELKVKSETIDLLYNENKLSTYYLNKKNIQLYPQEMIQFTANDRDNKTALAKFDGESIVRLKYTKISPLNIKALNREQTFALELLLDDNIKLVTLSGKAGTGKTLLALAAGLFKVLESNTYNRLLVSRPVIPMGKDIGFLPGTKEDKLQPWMQAIFDNLDFILQKEKNSKYNFDNMIDKDLIQIEALTYIRGRSVPNQFIIVDEAQNLSKHEIKTIITRAGKNSKIVLTGDPYQIDNPYLSLHKNGLSYLAYKFKNQNIAGHIMLQKGERSELARIASDLL